MLPFLTHSSYSIPTDNFTAHVTVHDGKPGGLMDQDFIHNGKKLINPLDSTAQTLSIDNLCSQRFCHIL